MRAYSPSVTVGSASSVVIFQEATLRKAAERHADLADHWLSAAESALLAGDPDRAGEALVQRQVHEDALRALRLTPVADQRDGIRVERRLQGMAVLTGGGSANVSPPRVADPHRISTQFIDPAALEYELVGLRRRLDRLDAYARPARRPSPDSLHIVGSGKGHHANSLEADLDLRRTQS